MIEKEMFHLDEISIVPAAVSAIKSRSDIHTRYSKNRLPIFTAPMASVVNENNFLQFQDLGIRTIIPRTVSLETRMKLCWQTFVALGTNEFKEMFVLSDIPEGTNITAHICLDVADGHLESIIQLCKQAKSLWKDRLVLMAGNIANPETIIQYSNANIDYVRVGIGGGSACTTSVQTGVHVPMGSLLQEIAEVRKYHSIKTKVVADGGFSRIDQIIKALALGADYVMVGEMFAKTKEACGPTILMRSKETGEDQIVREYFGMSTEKAQELISSSKTIKNSEGLTKYVPVEYSISDWVVNFEAALRSAMSYAGSFTLLAFREKTILRKISPVAFAAYSRGKQTDNLKKSKEW